MSQTSPSPGVLTSLRSIASTSLALLQTRLALLAVELEEEKHRLTGLLLWGAITVLALGVGLVFLAVFLTVMLWDSHRLLVMAISAGVFCTLGTIAAFMFLRLLRAPSELFSASLAELSQDRAGLRNTNPQ